ncbi:MAG: ABC transporter ATP-binding protein [Verrucomicrobiota bacterium]
MEQEVNASESHPAIRIKNVSKQFGSHRVLDQIDTTIEPGEIVAFVGPSGCGKSTLLNCIVGTLEPTSGSIEVWNKDTDQMMSVNGPGRDRGIVYQRYSLFPHLTALQNVAFGLMLDETEPHFRWLNPFAWRKLRKAHLEKSEEILTRVGLAKAMHNYPTELSGGMCQRVAIAQALVMRPQILLMDEPFGALDEATRESLQRLLLELYHQNQVAKEKGERPPHTIIIVTHEIEEAIFVGDRIIGLSQRGRDGNGASIVFDEAQPVFKPDDLKDSTVISQEKSKVIEAAFGSDYGQDTVS